MIEIPINKDIELGCIKEDLCRSFARHRLDFLADYKMVKHNNITYIPNEKNLFPNTNDHWVLYERTKDYTIVIYTIAPLSIFPTHFHIGTKEEITILTEDAQIEWVTERNISTHYYNETFYALENEEHALVNLSDFEVKLRIKWYQRRIDGFNTIFTTD